MKILPFFVFCMVLTGCVSYTPPDTNPVFLGGEDEIESLRKHLDQISKNNTFPHIVGTLKRSAYNPDRFELVRAETSLHQKRTRNPSGIHITYYYLIRIHFRDEERTYRKLILSYQDYALYPDGKIQILPKKR